MRTERFESPASNFVVVSGKRRGRRVDDGAPTDGQKETLKEPEPTQAELDSAEENED